VGGIAVGRPGYIESMIEEHVPESTLERMAELIRRRRVVVLTGAGCSTESGIPDYRGNGAPKRPRSPIQYGTFVRDPQARARYWARSAVGWTRIQDAEPNPAHTALAELERAGAVRGVITQNVDGLHGRAGSRRVVELHGALARARCMACGAVESRAALQKRILARNPSIATSRAAVAPDGDAEVDAVAVASFVVPGCRRCGGVLKPDVVLFGESVPKTDVAAAWRLYDEAEALLVVGSSLAVFSGRRFVLRASKQGVPVAIVNQGPTRGDEHARLKLEGRAGLLLPLLAQRLSVA
jgi:NAD-dependent deacetylase sirtuin 4